MRSLSIQEAPLQVSKWVKIPFLVDPQELEILFSAYLPPFSIYDVHQVVGAREGIYTPTDFLETYTSYIAYLQRGEIPPFASFRPLFSSVWAVTEESLYALEIPGERRILKVCSPSLQLQPHSIRYSGEERVFRSSFGTNGISWGIQIGFPHLYVDPHTCAIQKTKDFPNISLFQGCQRWIRAHTLPTPFRVGEERVKVPMRIGKASLSWIHNHPQLATQQLVIDRHFS